jgi:hypothetical protein
MTLSQFKQLFASQINKSEKGSKLYYGVRDSKANRMEIMSTTEHGLSGAYASLKSSKPDSPVKAIPWFTK